MTEASNRQRLLWTAGFALAFLAAAQGAPLDVDALEREIRSEILVFSVATGGVGTMPDAVDPARLDSLHLQRLAREAGDGERALAFCGELARRELSLEERIQGIRIACDWWTADSDPSRRDAWKELAERWALPLWDEWEAGTVPDAQRHDARCALFGHCMMELPANATPEEECRWRERWEKRFQSLFPADGDEDGAGELPPPLEDSVVSPGGTRTEGTEAVAAAERGSESPAERHFRHGVEMARLGRWRDATASWREAERLAEEAGDTALAREIRAALARDGAWAWHREERRVLCEAELENGSPWRECLLETLAEDAEDENDTATATAFALEGFRTWGAGRSWAARAGRAVCKGGGADLPQWHQACGERLERIPAVEERREEIRTLVEFRWAMGDLFPGRIAPSLEPDLARLRERAAEGAAEPEEARVPLPGARWREAEPSWRVEPAVPDIEREFDEILLAPAWERDWEAWREKWPLEERRALRVDGAGAEFVSLAEELRHGYWYDRDKTKALGERALAECKAQEGFDGERLIDVLWALVVEGASCEDPAKLAEWVEWARLAAAGDDVLGRLRVALLDLLLADRMDNGSALRRMTSDKRLAPALCTWASGWVPGFGTWETLARGVGGREAAALAVLKVRMSGSLWNDLAVASLMDAMTAEELEELRDAFRLRSLANAAEALDAGGKRVLDLLAVQVGDRRARNWRNVELHLRLARLEEQGADGGEEGRALAEALGTESVRGTLARLRWRLAGGTDPAEEPAEAGRWREWCACVRKLAKQFSGPSPYRWVGASCPYPPGGNVNAISPWLDRMQQRGLLEALAAWGTDATEGEQGAIAAALEAIGGEVEGDLRGDWTRAAASAGEWASAALAEGRAESGESRGPVPGVCDF